ncbi:hypothetical protein KOW79_010917 [Hemibagrus wyckioides]|uniref:Uncharacterized protein n=1 Tax=Hemibagrus wyckioides TaxID=337641 RepID=A0A9D3NPL0_9TELE|nr:hypothetical protein KOW79_010917 [Hemibagrus wyckioides]
MLEVEDVVEIMEVLEVEDMEVVDIVKVVEDMEVVEKMLEVVDMVDMEADVSGIQLNLILQNEKRTSGLHSHYCSADEKTDWGSYSSDGTVLINLKRPWRSRTG